MLTTLWLLHLLASQPCEINPRWRVRVIRHVLIIDWVEV